MSDKKLAKNFQRVYDDYQAFRKMALARRLEAGESKNIPPFWVWQAAYEWYSKPVVPLWVDPNNKTQKQFLPHIGEQVFFKHDGRTYTGKHTGGSFQANYPRGKHFDTWSCLWAYPDAVRQASSPVVLTRLKEPVAYVGADGTLRWIGSEPVASIMERSGLMAFSVLYPAPCAQITAAPTDPFGYFKAVADGWVDCAETDEGAKPLYEAPQPSDEGMDAALDMLDAARADLEMLRKMLGVAVEPHQTLADRMLEAAAATVARVYTHNNQPSNEIAYDFGAACFEARTGGGDTVDLGLSLLRALQAKGFGITPSHPQRKNKNGR